MWRFRRSAILLLAVVVLAACSPAADPATPRPEATRPASPGQASAFLAPSRATDELATLIVTTQSHVYCPLIAPSLRADCGFLPLPAVRLAVTTEAGAVLTLQTGDDGTVRVPVNPGVVGVRGAAVSADLSRPPLPVTFDVLPGQVRAVVLIYERDSQCRLRAENSVPHRSPRMYQRPGAGQPVVTRGACP